MTSEYTGRAVEVRYRKAGGNQYIRCITKQGAHMDQTLWGTLGVSQRCPKRRKRELE
jgi:hypothetical protein